MNERNVAYGGDSLYPRGRGINMSDKRNGETEKPSGARGEKSSSYFQHMESSSDEGQARIKHLQDLLERGFDKDLGISQDVENLVRFGTLPKVDDLKTGAPEIKKQIVMPHIIVDESGKKVVETQQLFPFMSREVASKAALELELEIEFPDKWDDMDPIHKGRWLKEKKGIYSFSEVDMNANEDLILPEIRGASDELPWKDPLIAEIPVVDENGNEKIVERPISLTENMERLVILAELNDSSSEDYTKLRANLDELIESIKAAKNDTSLEKNYELLRQINQSADYLAYRHESAGTSDLFEKVLPNATREDLLNTQMAWNDEFRKKYNNNRKKYERLFQTLEEDSAQVISFQESGLYGLRADEQRRRFEAVANREISLAASAEDREMLRWRKEVLKQGFDLHFSEKSIMQPKGDWQDSEENLDKIIRYLESTEFDDQQLSAKLNAAARIVQGIPVDSLKGHEKEKAEKIQRDLTEKLQAIVAFNSLYSAAEHSDLNPEKVLSVAGHLKDNTLEIFFERFTLRDENGKKIKYKVAAGVDAVEESDRDLNLMSIGMNVYMERLSFERKVFNHIEEWTKNPDAKPNTGDKDLDDACKFAIDTIEGKLTKTVADKKAAGEKEEINTGDIKDAIKHYHKNYTLLGSHDEHNKEQRKEEMIGIKDRDPAPHVWKKGIVEELRSGKYGLSEEKINELIKDGVIDQVMNNSYKLSWLMAFSEYDGIRVYDPSQENPVKGGARQVGFVYSGSTHLFHGRMVDHGWDFMIDEARGKVGKTNYLMQSEMLGKHGNLLPQNRALVRWAKDLMPKRAKEYIKDNIGETDNIKKLDMGNEPEKGWADSAVIGEGIDSGDLSLANTDWMNLFKTEDSWKYKWIDLYGDRKAHMDFMGTGALQKYLKTPNSKVFFQINSDENFYSKREVRLQPWMKLVIPAHIAIGDKWKEWWHIPDRMTHAEKEDVIEYAVTSNRVDVKYDSWMREEYLGWGGLRGYGPVRFARRMAEIADVSTRVGTSATVKNLPFWPLYWSRAYAANLMKYLTS